MADEMTEEGKIEEAARALEWVPKEEFQGDPADWMDAAAWVDYQKKLNPILKKTNARLHSEMTAMRQQVNKLAQELEAAREDFSTLEEFHEEEVTRRVEETRKELLSQIKDAKRSGDVDTEVDLTDQLQRLNNVNAKTEQELEDGEERKNGKRVESVNALTPEYTEWKGRNGWFEVDAVRTYETMAIASKLTQERPDLRGQAFFAELDKRISGKTQRPGAGKVEGSRGSSTGGEAAGRTYADLPAEAKAQCDKYAKKFVRKDGKFKTEAEYRQHYVRELENTGYFS